MCSADRSGLGRRAAFGFLAQRVETGEHFVRCFARISALRFGDGELGVKMCLRSCALGLLWLIFGQCALRHAQLLFGLLQLHRPVFGCAERLLCLLHGRCALRHSLICQIRYTAARAEDAEHADR